MKARGEPEGKMGPKRSGMKTVSGSNFTTHAWAKASGIFCTWHAAKHERAYVRQRKRQARKQSPHKRNSIESLLSRHAGLG